MGARLQNIGWPPHPSPLPQEGIGGLPPVYHDLAGASASLHGSRLGLSLEPAHFLQRAASAEPPPNGAEIAAEPQPLQKVRWIIKTAIVLMTVRYYI
ncbi:hypothetical protein NDU88_005471 [Pleurodeles waltl]|uniref:Uncharacterized protein n=1 Tax=Pleurodeles waltl TaxID=8319 RepID=A0AAV7QFD8_PLEWA|nr:hypothetical protein NDU88_005471 [Pleurodeles waltl]